MKAVILCGGKGTRLRPYTHSVPKPMLLLGRKPILEYTIQHLKREGFKDIILAVGHLHEQVEEYFGDGRKFGVKIQYSTEKDELGDAGSLKNAARLLEKEDSFLVEMGDHLTNMDYGKLEAFHEKNKPLATVGLKRIGTPLQYGTATVNEKFEITEFNEKPILENLINSAVYVFDRKALDYFPAKGVISFDVIPKLVRERKIKGFVFDDYWVDVGNINEYEKLNQSVSIVDLLFHAMKE
ncbi:TPA: nucleotidyltransferase family protein [Candidatus Micrarchaeota archaeon]|nr:nucleotidyltransferase family protein [Candidatus Micrarchaeota archaeon]